MKYDFDDEEDLTTCETFIMKTIWDAGGELPFMDLQKLLKEKFKKDYSRTTVATFLLKLSDKGYVENYRKGRNSFTRALKSEDEYKKKLLEKETEFWFSKNPVNMISTLCEYQKLTKEDIDEIRSVLDGLDY